MRAKFIIFILTILIGYTIVRISFINNNTIYSSFYEISNSNWSVVDTIVFDLKTTVVTNPHNLNLFGKINYDFSYSNLFVFINHYFEKEIIKKDTVLVPLFDSFGKPIQNNIGNTQFFNVDYLNNVNFTEEGVYKIELIHGMRENKLDGVEKIGIKLKKNN